MGEFDLIKRYFTRPSSTHSDVLLAVGDDCAITTLAPDQQLAITTDTLVEDCHFLPDISPADLAYKAVAVNLSDLAAMGATPRWCSLALTLPQVDHAWLHAFSQSLFAILDQHNVALIGGDTTQGKRSLTLTLQGTLPKGKGLFRHQAKAGDGIYVSGTLGDSAAGLSLLLNPPQSALNADQQALLARHLRPTARVALGQLLTQYSECAIDLSDGLLADLSHILQRSQCGARLELQKLPISAPLARCFSAEQATHFALTGGENYELCFTLRPEQQAAFEHAVKALDLPCQRIGTITDEVAQLTLWQSDQPVPLPTQKGFDHFAR